MRDEPVADHADFPPGVRGALLNYLQDRAGVRDEEVWKQFVQSEG
jgi:hypothetical protein